MSNIVVETFYPKNYVAPVVQEVVKTPSTLKVSRINRFGGWVVNYILECIIMVAFLPLVMSRMREIFEQIPALFVGNAMHTIDSEQIGMVIIQDFVSVFNLFVMIMFFGLAISGVINGIIMYFKNTTLAGLVMGYKFAVVDDDTKKLPIVKMGLLFLVSWLLNNITLGLFSIYDIASLNKVNSSNDFKNGMFWEKWSNVEKVWTKKEKNQQEFVSNLKLQEVSLLNRIFAGIVNFIILFAFSIMFSRFLDEGAFIVSVLTVTIINIVCIYVANTSLTGLIFGYKFKSTDGSDNLPYGRMFAFIMVMSWVNALWFTWPLVACVEAATMNSFVNNKFKDGVFWEFFAGVKKVKK